MREIIEDNIDCAGPGGIVTIEVIRDGKNGPEVIERRKAHNLIVDQGKEQIWRLVSGSQTRFFDHFRIGTSSQAAAVGQVNLTSPITGTLIIASGKTLLAATRTHEWVVSYASGGGSKSATNIQEVVLMNQATSPGGSCMMRAVFTAVNKTTADKLKITYNARIT
jgi:hypothetical protein